MHVCVHWRVVDRGVIWKFSLSKYILCLFWKPSWWHPSQCSALGLYCLQSFHQFSPVVQLCLTLCNPVDCSTPGLPVDRQLLELTHTHIHQVGDAIQTSHPLSSPSPPAFNLSIIRVFPNESGLCIRCPKYWTFSQYHFIFVYRWWLHNILLHGLL